MEESAIRKSGRDQILSVGELEGRWRVERLSGALPPIVGVSKEIRGERGKVRFGLLPGPPFRVERREDRIMLVYHPPFSILTDELRVDSEDSWVGRAMIGGCELGRFRMVRSR